MRAFFLTVQGENAIRFMIRLMGTDIYGELRFSTSNRNWQKGELCVGTIIELNRGNFVSVDLFGRENELEVLSTGDHCF